MDPDSQGKGLTTRPHEFRALEGESYLGNGECVTKAPFITFEAEIGVANGLDLGDAVLGADRVKSSIEFFEQ
jgi:hypothetical protein